MRNVNRRRRMLLLNSGEATDAPADESTDESLSIWDDANESGDRAFDKFRNACGATVPIHLRVSGPGISGHQDHQFESPFVIVGRSQKADLQLSHPQVSLRHIYLQVIDNHLYCIDLENRTDRSNTKKRTPLPPDGIFHVGPFSLEILDQDNWDSVNSAGVSDSKVNLLEGSDEMARVTIEVLNCSKGERYRAIEDAITFVGNISGCQVKLKDRSISKVHCALVRTSESLWCVDLLGRRGTQINGANVHVGRLYDEDFLKIGRAKIRIHYSTPMTNMDSNDHIQTPSDSQTVQFPQDLKQTPPMQESTAQETPPSQMLAQTPFGDIPFPVMAPPPPVQLPQVAEGNSPAERQVSEAFALSLVNQFGQMQQQMFQQSQQSMMMMLNMFSTLHQNHMELIRDDLSRLHEITSELQAVQSQMAAGQPATNVSFTREPQPAADDFVQDAFVQDAVVTDPAMGHHFQPTPPLPTESVSENGPSQGEPFNIGTNPAEPPASGNSNNKKADRKPRSDRSGVKTHAALSERLAALESERNSRWQKIMQTIKGIGGN